MVAQRRLRYPVVVRRPALVIALAATLTAALDVATVRDAHCGPAEDAKAAKLFERAESEYQAGHFQAAIDLLLEAQRLAPDPVLHYNLARAYEGLGDLDHAIASYDAYVKADPGSKDRGAVEARLRTLEQQKAARDKPVDRAPPERPPPTVDKPSPSKRSASPVPWIIAGVGALGLGVGGVLGGLSLGAKSDAEDPESSGVDVESSLDRARTLALGANITFAVGGTLALAGAIWGIVDVATLGKPDKTAARIRIGPTGALLVVPL